MSSELVFRVLERNAAACGTGALQHDDCRSSGECAEALDYYRRLHAPDTSSFDARHQLLLNGRRFPDETWSTAALLLLVRDSVAQPPWQDPLRRTLATTSALARLAERGLPAGAVLRTCFGHAIVRRIVIQVCAVWVLAQDENLPRSTGSVLDSWLAILDAQPPAAGRDGSHHVADVVVSALRGPLGDRATDWVARASVTHILGWRLEDFLVADIEESDLILPGGEAATRWVVDRFTETYPDDWHGPSLQWELAFQHAPEATAARVGLPHDRLAERVLGQSSVIEAIARRLTGGIGDDPVADGLRAAEIVETIVTLLRGAEHAQALALARRAVRAAPDHPALVVALAFCLVPVDTVEARRVLDRLDGSGVPVDPAVTVDRATLCLADGDWTGFSTTSRHVPSDPGGGGWFWDLDGVPRGEYVLRYYELAAWREHAEVILSRPRGAA